MEGKGATGQGLGVTVGNQGVWSQWQRGPMAKNKGGPRSVEESGLGEVGPVNVDIGLAPLGGLGVGCCLAPIATT